MRLYRLKHKRTGLYYSGKKWVKVKYATSSGRELSDYVKTNLSKTGKIYKTKPRKFASVYHDHTNFEVVGGIPISSVCDFELDNFEIEELPLK
jgi:uncharacterized protein YraI